MVVDFYQLSVSPIERVLPRICERLMKSGERLLIVAGAEQLGQLDALLWSYKPDSFLPHGTTGDPTPERQPILLGDTVEPVNSARNIALADGHWREDALRFERTFYFFDQQGVSEARDVWRGLNGREDVERRYWRQDNGKWVQGP